MKHTLTIQKNGQFFLKKPTDFSFLYMPLFNEHGAMSSITPTLAGDFKWDQHHFALPPVTSDDLMNQVPSRNFYFLVNHELWSTSGKTPWQKRYLDEVTLEGGLLYQTVTRSCEEFTVSVSSFVPSDSVQCELHRIRFTNTASESLTVQPTIGVQLYGRSADNIRDHHHVTSLLNRGFLLENGIVNEPTLKFDERGHRQNGALYGVFSTSSHHQSVLSYYPHLHEFCGEGGDLFFPEAPRGLVKSTYQVNDTVEGYEMMGGLGYDECSLEPGQTIELVVGIFIAPTMKKLKDEVKRYVSLSTFDDDLEKTKSYWSKQLSYNAFELKDESMTGWMRWVSLQPTMRRIYGCSFLPHHDYGRGGRGWRDLWQDSLSLILKEPHRVRSDIFGHFAGVRIDGSNATIVGTRPGEFFADRNKIVRVWSDHGAWPLLTVNNYLQKTGDLDFLLDKQTYFKDQFAFYTHSLDSFYEPSVKPFLKDRHGSIYQGTILEHLLIENLVPFFNVGVHGNIRIEDADWNDGMDMAKDKGETVAFTAFYAGNLQTLVGLLSTLQRNGLKEINVISELLALLDTLNNPIDYSKPVEKQERLRRYFESVSHEVSGDLTAVPIQSLIDDLRAKAMQLYRHINEQEWMEESSDCGWYNGYYDNDGHRLESTKESDYRMTLTGQTFPLMHRLASKPRVDKIIDAVNRHLNAEEPKLPRLNTRFDGNSITMGRFLGFAYGHKENGAIFSHMVVMYAYSLFENGEIREARRLIDELYRYYASIDQAKILPGIPEYIDYQGRGMYHYLTGSASWLVLTMIEHVFGLKGSYGDLKVTPHLLGSDFSESMTPTIHTVINGHECVIRFENPERLDYEQYVIAFVNGRPYGKKEWIIDQKSIQEPTTFVVTLGRK